MRVGDPRLPSEGGTIGIEQIAMIIAVYRIKLLQLFGCRGVAHKGKPARSALYKVVVKLREQMDIGVATAKVTIWYRRFGSHFRTSAKQFLSANRFSATVTISP